MVLSSIGGVTNQTIPTEIPKTETSVTESKVVRQISKKEVENMMSTEKYVRQYFSDVPILVQIAKCESHFRQLDPNGEIHRGVVNNLDVGVMQINEFYHLDQASKKNIDIYTLEGNTAYARDLYEREGTKPWSSSKACWGKYENKDLAINSK